jgi:hypothetical protein
METITRAKMPIALSASPHSLITMRVWNHQGRLPFSTLICAIPWIIVAMATTRETVKVMDTASHGRMRLLLGEFGSVGISGTPLRWF